MAANRAEKKKTGRPRTVGFDNGGPAPAIAVRLPPDVLAYVDRVATDSGKKRSDVIRDLVTAAYKKARK